MYLYQVYVISAGRYNKLPFTEKQKDKYIFCVKEGEKELYQQHGCKQVIETGGLCASRNFALQHAFEQGKICVQLSDDLKQVRLNSNFSNGLKTPVDLDEAIEKLVHFFLNENSDSKLLGVSPTDNDFFATEQVKYNCFCIGDFLIVKPSEIFFDESLPLKEDYDFTIQHVLKYGSVVRNHTYTFTFLHYKNSGGAVSYRNDIVEQQTINQLKQKWGMVIRDNPKRQNEILLNLPKKKSVKQQSLF